MSEKVIAKVLKYDPSEDAKPEYRTYEVSWRRHLTVLEVLRYINDEVEPLSFRYSCRRMSGGEHRCGICGIMVNEKPVCACNTLANPGEIIIEPLKGFPVIKDLVIDRSKYTQRMLRAEVGLRRISPMKSWEKVPKEVSDMMIDWEICKECLLCYAVCPLIPNDFADFAGPAIMLKIALRFFDPRDEADRLKQAVFEGLWKCQLCEKCTEVCPQNLRPLQDAIIPMREAAKAAGLKP
jgi:succinate dehydrogenase/fumarate reductase iron-sulfur protein